MEIIGRQEELAAMASFLEAGSREPHALLLAGDAGIGKTILWRQATDMARESSICSPLNRPAPRFSFCLFEASSRDAVEQANARAEIPFARIVEPGAFRRNRPMAASGPQVARICANVRIYRVMRRWC